jgi:hypothetical protein
MGIAKQIAYMFTENKGRADLEKLVTWIMFDQGLTEKRAREYISIVVRAKGWVVNDGFVSCSS